MADETSDDVALWYVRYGAPRYELYEGEQQAARLAAYMQEEGEGSVLGAQFPDGRLVKREDWAAFALAQQQLQDEWHAKDALRRSQPPPETKRILDPFGGQMLTVEADEPEWVGTPVP